MSMRAWNDARDNLTKARALLSLVGKPQRTTADAVGVLHALTVSATIHYQETDGATNYHAEKAFDMALSNVIKRRFSTLADEAIQLLEAKVSRTGKDARESVQSMLDQIDAYNQA